MCSPRRAYAAQVAALLGAFAVLTGFRPDDPDSTGLFRFEPGYDVEHYDSTGGRVRVHFTRTGPDAVRPQDADADGTPDAVALVADTYEEVLTAYGALGYRAPVSDVGSPTGDGGNDRLDVYLIDFAGASDGAFVAEYCELARPICSGYVAQENDYTGYGYPSFRVATRILASHELFHAVQAAYDAEQGANWGEATAVWASERFDPTLPDLEAFIPGWLDEPERAIDQEPIGPVDGYAYGLALFAQFLAERFDDDLHRLLWEDLVDGARGVDAPRWLPALEALLARTYTASFADAWTDFAAWVARCGHGRPAGTTFAAAARYPEVARDDVALPFQDDRLRVYRASMQVWAAPPLGRARVAAALPSTDPAATEGLVLLLATRRGDTVETAVFDPAGGAVDATDADEVLLFVANTATSGQSRRPGLCFGDEDEVATCVAALAPASPEPSPEAEPDVVTAPDPEPDAASGPDDALAADATADAAPPARDAGGCATGPAPGLPFAFALAAFLLARRARRVPGGPR